MRLTCNVFLSKNRRKVRKHSSSRSRVSMKKKSRVISRVSSDSKRATFLPRPFHSRHTAAPFLIGMFPLSDISHFFPYYPSGYTAIILSSSEGPRLLENVTLRLRIVTRGKPVRFSPTDFAFFHSDRDDFPSEIEPPSIKSTYTICSGWFCNLYKKNL